MAVSSAGYHEPLEQISAETRNFHRALVSLQEELEAVDWYRQRADACADPALKEILLHNMREEIEHACMVLEWLRRNHPDFERNLKTYLFTEAPITEIEEANTGKSNVAPAGPRLTIGSLKQREGQ
ncbi:MAG: ferritin-like domain-containing protein [Pseudomonadota bacterium]